MTSIRVRIRLDSFDLIHPREKQCQVYVHIEDVARASYLLPADRFEELRDAEWGDALDKAHAHFEDAGWVSDSATASARAAVRTWLDSDENRDDLNAAWFADRAQHDPVSRALSAQVERLTEQLAAAHAETKKTRAAVLALHPKYEDSDHCRNDGERFPCTTVRAVGGPAVGAVLVEALHASSGAVIETRPVPPREELNDSPLHHAYRIPRDLPEVRS